MFYMKAFYDLCTCRDLGMGVGPIPWSSIVEYTKWYELTKDVSEALIDIIRAMDRAYLSYSEEERKRTQNLNKAT